MWSNFDYLPWTFLLSFTFFYLALASTTGPASTSSATWQTVRYFFASHTMVIYIYSIVSIYRYNYNLRRNLELLLCIGVWIQKTILLPGCLTAVLMRNLVEKLNLLMDAVSQPGLVISSVNALMICSSKIFFYSLVELYMVEGF